MVININKIKNRKITGKHQTVIEQFLIEKIITQEQVNTALAEQKQTNEQLISILIRRGYLREEKLKEAWSRELHMEHLSNLNNVQIPVEIREIFSLEEMKSVVFVPLSLHNELLTIAISNPSDLMAMDSITERVRAFNPEWYTQFSIASKQDILDKVEEVFGLKSFAHFRDANIEDFIDLAVVGVQNADPGTMDLLPVQQLVDRIVLLGQMSKASDIHINPEETHVQVRYRIDGILFPGPSLPKELQNSVISRVKIMSHLNIAERRAPQDGKIDFVVEQTSLDLRVSIIPTYHGENIVIRILQRHRFFELNGLGMMESMENRIHELVAKTYGFFLVTGPTGAGKSTTLYAFLQSMNTIEKNIITLEDPIEYQISAIRQSQINASVGYNFATGLRAMLRHDPDVILVGEIRDQETASMAFHAAQTGHLVLSTLHTNTAIGAIGRLATMDVDIFLLSTILNGILAQRLVRSVCSHCKTKYTASELEMQWLKKEKQIDLVKGSGCERCNGRGYVGRIGIFELFVPDADLRNAILQNKSEAHIKELAQHKDMKFFYDDACEKVCAGLTSFSEVMRVLPELASYSYKEQQTKKIFKKIRTQKYTKNEEATEPLLPRIVSNSFANKNTSGSKRFSLGNFVAQRQNKPISLPEKSVDGNSSGFKDKV